VAVEQRITSVDYPSEIAGKAGEQFQIVITSRLEGEGSSVQFLELLVNGDSLGEAKTDGPMAPDGLRWTCTLTVKRDISPGTVLDFEAVAGHIEGGGKVRDDSRRFSIRVARPVQVWEKLAIIAGLVSIGALGLMLLRESRKKEKS